MVFRAAILHLDVIGLILICQVVGLHHAEAGVVAVAIERAVEDVVNVQREGEVVTEVEGKVSAGDAEIADILDARDVAEVVIRLVETVSGVEAVGGRCGLGGGVVVGIVGRLRVRIRNGLHIGVVVAVRLAFIAPVVVDLDIGVGFGARLGARVVVAIGLAVIAPVIVVVAIVTVIGGNIDLGVNIHIGAVVAVVVVAVFTVCGADVAVFHLGVVGRRVGKTIGKRADLGDIVAGLWIITHFDFLRKARSSFRNPSHLKRDFFALAPDSIKIDVYRCTRYASSAVRY